MVLGYLSRRSLVLSLVAAGAMAGCGETTTAHAPGQPPSGGSLVVSLANSTLLTGVDRISLALFDHNQRPIMGARATLDIQGSHGTFEQRPLEDIGPQYGNIPVYVGTARLPQIGEYHLVVHATLADGTTDSGSAIALVKDKGPELPVGGTVPAVRQPILGDPGVTVTAIDSGVPPDSWHTATVADGLAQHRPMVLYFGQPGYCPTRTCGPTVQILQDLAQQYGDRLFLEHIETHDPASADPNAQLNPAFEAFRLQTDPWVYFVNSAGVVSDRFEGPITLAELRSAADGTLAGRVPAVDVSLGD